MNASINSNGGQVAASIETKAAVEAEASLENKDGTGAVLASDEEGEANMKETEATNKQPHEGNEPEPVEIEIDQIRFDDVTYPRAHINEDAVHEYSEAMKNKVRFPEIEVYRSGETFWLSDGRHRLEAGKKAGMTRVWARVYEGGQRDAILRSLAANLGHGVRRTNEDKRKAVMIVLQDPEWRKWNDTKIASRCHVSPPLVKTIRDELAGTDHGKELDDGNSSIVERNGKRFPQKRKAAAKPLPTHIAAIAEMRELARSARASVIGDDPGLAERLHHMGSELHEILGKATGAQLMTEGLREPLNIYERERKTGIEKDEAFEEKGLATHAFNIGLGCGHQCSYCSSASVRCLNKAYGELQLKPSSRGFAVIDPKASDLISADKPKLTAADTVLLGDAWSPEARKHGVGRKCLDALLSKTTARVRILTKSADVVKDLDVAKDDKDRVMVGISLGIPEDCEEVAAAVEPNASPIRERLKALKQAHDLKFPVYAMFCPCLPLVADTEAALTRMFRSVRTSSPEGIWLEPVNARGKALQNTEEALRVAGLKAEADAVDAIRKHEAWSKYAADLAVTAARVAEAQGVLEKLHVLMYTAGLTAGDLERVKALGACVTLLGNDAEGSGKRDHESESLAVENGGTGKAAGAHDTAA